MRFIRSLFVLWLATLAAIGFAVGMVIGPIVAGYLAAWEVIETHIDRLHRERIEKRERGGSS